MKLWRIFLLSLALAGLVGLGAGAARADCIKDGVVYSSFLYAASATFSLMEGAYPTNYFIFNTDDEAIIDYLAAAQAAGLRVRIVGDAASCPASGSGGNIKSAKIYAGY
jgi:hypothetical protein